MPYNKTRAHLTCDFCGAHVQLSLDDHIFSIGLEGRNMKWIVYEYTLNVADAGSFHQGVDLYACEPCEEKAREAVAREEGEDALCQQSVYEWLDVNSPSHMVYP